MTKSTKQLNYKRQHRGAAAVEFAILLVILFPLLAGTVFIGRVFWHYTVAQKAAYDAARYLSSASETEMRMPALTLSAVDVASKIISAELAELNTGGDPPLVTILCDLRQCGGLSIPTTIRVSVQLAVRDLFFGFDTGTYHGLVISADVEMAYLGTR